MSARHLNLGRRGEEAAVAYLESRGYVVLERNWRHRQLELDVVCRDADTIIFVEVRTRGEGSLAAAGQTLDEAKMSKLRKAASHYLSENELWDSPCRFDFVAVTAAGGELAIEHVEDAFGADLSSHSGDSSWQPW